MRRAVVVSGALALAVSTAGPAWAAPPLEVTGQVTDQTAALGSRTREEYTDLLLWGPAGSTPTPGVRSAHR